MADGFFFYATGASRSRSVRYARQSSDRTAWFVQPSMALISSHSYSSN